MGERLQIWFWKSQAEILHKCFWKIFSVCESPAEPHWMRFGGLVNKINACARKYIFTFFLVFAWVCESLFSANGNDSRMRKTQIENQSNDHPTSQKQNQRRAIPDHQRMRTPLAWNRFALLWLPHFWFPNKMHRMQVTLSSPPIERGRILWIMRRCWNPRLCWLYLNLFPSEQNQTTTTKNQIKSNQIKWKPHCPHHTPPKS